MDRTERFYKIDQLLNEKIVVSIETFLDDLGVSLATFKRDLNTCGSGYMLLSCGTEMLAATATLSQTRLHLPSHYLVCGLTPVKCML